MNFDQRMATGHEFELLVADRLAKLGWAVCPYGQGTYPSNVRAGLRQWRTLFRWAPDLLAVRPPREGEDLATFDGVRLIDAKADRPDTSSYAFERSAVEAHHRHLTAYGLHVWLIYPDGRCFTAHDALTCDAIRPGPDRGNGSGTPFWLLPKGAPVVRLVRDAFA